VPLFPPRDLYNIESRAACGKMAPSLAAPDARGEAATPQNPPGRTAPSSAAQPSRGRVFHYNYADIHLYVLNNSYDRMYL
jgi:hypothetical protein